MPTPHHLKNLSVPGNRFTLREAAAQGLMLSLHCKRCRRPPTLFLASDLVQVLPPSLDCFHPPPFACSRCDTDRYIEVKLRAQDAAAVGRIMVRRLAGIRQVPIWRDELLGDRPATPPAVPTNSHSSARSGP